MENDDGVCEIVNGVQVTMNVVWGLRNSVWEMVYKKEGMVYGK